MSVTFFDKQSKRFEMSPDGGDVSGCGSIVGDGAVVRANRQKVSRTVKRPEHEFITKKNEKNYRNAEAEAEAVSRVSRFHIREWDSYKYMINQLHFDGNGSGT